MMNTADLIEAFAKHRGDAIVISGRGGRHWIQQSDTALDIPLGDPAMGGHAGFGLGFERLVMYLSGMENIRDVIPFPRTPRHCEF